MIKRYLVTALLLALSPVAFGQVSPAPAAAPLNPANAPVARQQVTVAFWNIEWFPGKRPNARKDEEDRQTQSVYSDLKKIDADVIGMEEIRDFASASLAVKNLAGFKVDVCANFPPREGQKEAQQPAIASRLPALSAWSEEWQTNGALVPPRGFAFAAYQVGPRQLLLVYALHLKSNRGDLKDNVPLRQESIRQLRAHMEAMEKAYSGLGNITWIVGGDFNTSLDDKTYAAETTLNDLKSAGFKWAWEGIPFSARYTIAGGGPFPPNCFDHIFYKNATLRKAWMGQTTPQSSDHHAVIATFDLPGAK